MYGLVDDLSIPAAGRAVIEPLRSSLQQQVLNAIGDAPGSRNATQLAVDYTTKKGWYVDLPGAGERVNTTPALNVGALVFTTNLPTPNLCTRGGSSFTNILDYRTGGRLTLSESPSSTPYAKSMASAPVLLKTKNGAIRAVTRTATGEILETPVLPKPLAGVTKRKSWRELML